MPNPYDPVPKLYPDYNVVPPDPEPPEVFVDKTPEEVEEELNKLKKELGVEEEIVRRVPIEQAMLDIEYDEERMFSDMGNNLYSLWLAPDGKGVMLQGLVEVYQKQEPILFPNNPDGTLPWKEIQEAYFPNGQVYLPPKQHGPIWQGPRVAAESPSHWQQIVERIAKIISIREATLAYTKKNPYK
jgi:hypothetical protein